MFIVYCRDGRNQENVRKEKRQLHVDYLQKSLSVLRCAGPLLSTGGHPTGGLFVLDVASQDEAEDWARDDPLAQAGVYERVDVLQWKYLLGDGVSLVVRNA